MMVEDFPDRKIDINGKEYLYFGGTSYLGMATNREFQDLVITGIKKWGTFYGSSRTANVKLAIYEKAEALFSDWIGAEASITVSSGTLAGRIVIDYLSKTIKSFFHYPKTHPAILHKDSLPLFVNGNLHPRLLDDEVEEVVITADIPRSLEVFPTSFEFLEQISINKTITLIVDESHSLGILGDTGQGIFKDISGNRPRRKIMISSIGKALGLSGGVIASDNQFIMEIKNEASFITSSGANPAYLEAFINAQSLYNYQLQKLKSNMKILFTGLNSDAKSGHNKNYPVLYFDQEGFYTDLLKKGIVITSFDYPSYERPMNRVVITANHTEEDLNILSMAINDTIA